VFATRGLAKTVFVAVGLLQLAAAPASAQAPSWRTDYASALVEARDKNLPLLLDFGTQNCVWCRKLDEATLRDPAVVRLLRQSFIPLRIDGDKNARLTQALGVRSYPTLVFAAPDGRILGAQEGFVAAPELLKKLQLTVLASYSKSSPDLAKAPAGPQAGSVVVIVPTGFTTPAPDTERSQAARALLTQAQDDYRKQQYVACLEHCRLLAAGYTDLPEGVEAQKLTAAIKTDPSLALRACAELSAHLADLYLSVADNWVRQGQTQQAVPLLERVLLLSPGTPQAEAARALLTGCRAPSTERIADPAPQRP